MEKFILLLANECVRTAGGPLPGFPASILQNLKRWRYACDRCGREFPIGAGVPLSAPECCPLGSGATISIRAVSPEEQESDRYREAFELGQAARQWERASPDRRDPAGVQEAARRRFVDEARALRVRQAHLISLLSGEEREKALQWS